MKLFEFNFLGSFLVTAKDKKSAKKFVEEHFDIIEVVHDELYSGGVYVDVSKEIKNHDDLNGRDGSAYVPYGDNPNNLSCSQILESQIKNLKDKILD